jgi:hypothetical protein
VIRTQAITFFPNAVNTGQKYPKSLKFIAAKKLFSGVNHTANKTALTIPACIDPKIKNKQKFNLKEQSALK